MDKAPIPHILILEDDGFISMELESLVEEVVRSVGSQAKITCFNRDDDAARYVIKYARNIALVIQNMTRYVPGQFAERWGQFRVKQRNTFGLRWSGGDFYYYIFDAFIPEAGCIFQTAIGDHETLELLEKWSRIDKRIHLISKPFHPRTVIESVQKCIERWIERDTSSSVEEENRLIIPVSEELIAICGANEDYLSKLSPSAFEKMVGAILQNHGFYTELTASTCDGGYDIRAVSNSRLSHEVTLVEVKRWAPHRCVPVGVIRALYGVRALHMADRAMLVTTSYVSQYAKREFSRTIPVELELVERDELISWCKRYRDQIFKLI